MEEVNSIVLKYTKGRLKFEKEVNHSYIIYLEAFDGYSKFHLTNGAVIIVNGSLKHYSTILPSTFKRVAKKFIINTNLLKDALEHYLVDYSEKNRKYVRKHREKAKLNKT